MGALRSGMIDNVWVAETAREECMLRVAIIIGSTRPGRRGEAVARWVYDIAHKRRDAAFELVDLKDFGSVPQRP